MELSDAQRLAVTTVGKNICVSAGAGSGKTRILVERFIHLVKECHISPAAILAITFTDKAANEMKRRIVERLREENLEEARREVENAAIGTIHSFSARLLREHPVEAGVDPYFVILESAEAELLQEKVLEEVIEKLAIDPEVFDFLAIYGEEEIQKGILETYRKSRNSETPYEAILNRRTQASRESFVSELRKGLEKIAEVKGADEVRENLERIFKRNQWDEQTIHMISSLKGKLRAAGKQKEEIRHIQELLLDMAAFLREEASSVPPPSGTASLIKIFIRIALEFEKRYEEVKREERALDFDDLQILAVRLLGSDSAAVPGGGNARSKAVRKIYQEKYRAILVDEFQDTNHLQDRLIELIRRESNLFLVGDLKQSIYAFRGTCVEIFIEKEKSFRQTPDSLVVSLAENYRAQPGLIHFVNPFFETLWHEDGFPFEPLQAMRFEEGEAIRIERLELEKDKEENQDDIRIREARSLAQHVLNLVKDEKFAFKDIACLFEAMTPVHFYEQEFRKAGIPYFVVSNRGFYSQPEIRDVLNFISCLENPRRDIPLAATLRSPLFQISDDTLFWLTRQAKQKQAEIPLFEGVRSYEFIPEISEGEREKLKFFKQTFEYLLEQKGKLHISTLIEKILHFTDYDLYVLKTRQGNRGYANLRKLVEVAREMESKESLHLGDFVRAIRGLETREIRESQAQVEAEEGNVVRLMSIHMAKGLEFPVVILPDLGRRDRSEGVHFLLSDEGLGLRVPSKDSGDFEETLTFRRNKSRAERIRSEESKRLLYVAMTRAKERLILSGLKPDATDKESFHEMPTWAHWIDRVLSNGNWNVRVVEEALPEAFPFEKTKAFAERKPIRTRLENLSALPLRKEPAGVDSILENLVPAQKAYFERIDLPVSAFLLFDRDPEEYFRVYEIGIPPAFEIKDEEPQDEVEAYGGTPLLPRAEFGTLVHQILEQVLVRKLKGREAEALVLRFTQGTGRRLSEEILNIVRRFTQSEQAQEVWNGKAFHAELPFSLRLPHGIIQGSMDLVYQNQKSEWLILDYKTSDVNEDSFAKRGEEYRVQLELYALALWKILGAAPLEARVYFLRPGLTHRIPFVPSAFDKLFERFTDFQRQILQFRKVRLSVSG